MINISSKLWYLAFLLIFVILVNIPLPSESKSNDNIQFVKAALKSNANFVKRMLMLEPNVENNKWVLSIFKTEKVSSISIDFANEKTTLLNVLFSERKFNLVVNEGQGAEYFMTILINNKGEFSLSDLSVRIE